MKYTLLCLAAIATCSATANAAISTTTVMQAARVQVQAQDPASYVRNYQPPKVALPTGRDLNFDQNKAIQDYKNQMNGGPASTQLVLPANTVSTNPYAPSAGTPYPVNRAGTVRSTWTSGAQVPTTSIATTSILNSLTQPATSTSPATSWRSDNWRDAMPSNLTDSERAQFELAHNPALASAKGNGPTYTHAIGAVQLFQDSDGSWATTVNGNTIRLGLDFEAAKETAYSMNRDIPSVRQQVTELLEANRKLRDQYQNNDYSNPELKSHLPPEQDMGIWAEIARNTASIERYYGPGIEIPTTRTSRTVQYVSAKDTQQQTIDLNGQPVRVYLYNGQKYVNTTTGTIAIPSYLDTKEALRIFGSKFTFKP